MLHSDIAEAVAIVNASTALKSTPKGAAVLALVADYASGGILGDKIVYDPSLPPNQYGNSYGKSYSPAPRIEINAAFIGDPAATAHVLAHEALHRAMGDDKTIDGELACRAQDAVFGQELVAGLAYTPPAGGTAVASLSGSALMPEVMKTITNVGSQKSLDYILGLELYQKNLTAQWVLANYRAHGGGLRNREPNTLGHFLRVLTNGGSPSNAPQIVDVLEAIQAPGWPVAKKAAGDLAPLRQSLRMVYDSMILGNRIKACETRFGERFRA
ncbi:MAG: hypothetical protein MUE98_06590 [Rhodobacteraceae bacterium]|jgi:hypothetical protein|nr:hypothetical protein [Paracoccaceae bacterium]